MTFDESDANFSKISMKRRWKVLVGREIEPGYKKIRIMMNKFKSKCGRGRDTRAGGQVRGPCLSPTNHWRWSPSSSYPEQKIKLMYAVKYMEGMMN